MGGVQRMDTKDLAGLSDGQVIDEAADSIKLLARTTGARPEYYRNLIARLRGIAVAVEERVDPAIGPKDFAKAYEALGGVPDSLKHFIQEVDRAKLEDVDLPSDADQMPPPDNKVPTVKKKSGRPRKVRDPDNFDGLYFPNGGKPDVSA